MSGTILTNTVTLSQTDGRLELLGVNTAGASFSGNGGPPQIGTTHTYTTHETIDYFASKGMDVIRLDLSWERLQPNLRGALNETEMRRVDDVVAHAESKGVAVVVSLHNYGKYNDQLIGSGAVPTSAYADVWTKLATRYADDPNAIFGLMNEPYAQSAAQWLPIANAGIKAIRDAGAKQEILVPGTYWDGAHSWVSSDNDTVVGAGVVDPLRNYAFEVHQYLDRDSSGTTPNTVSETIGVERLRAITEWAERTGNRLFLGEFGVSTDPVAIRALDNMLAYMAEHNGVWQGGTYWAAGEWWGDYYFAAQPINGVDRPQVDVLEKYVSPQTVPYWEAGAAPAPQPVPVIVPVTPAPVTPAPVIVPVTPAPVTPAPTTPAPTTPVTTGGSDTLVLRVSEDAYRGDAQFTVSVDGRQLGGTYTAHAARAEGRSEAFEFKGDWGVGQHKVSVSFLNDASGGAGNDRNLYVEGATFNGAGVAGANLEMLSGGAREFSFNDTSAVGQVAAPVVASGSDTLVLRVSEDAYRGDAQFTVSVDGRQLGGTHAARAAHGEGKSETLEFKGDWGVGQHKVAVTFLNDGYGGSYGQDRNLYVEGATFNGAAVAGAKLDLPSTGTREFAFTDSTAVPAAAKDALFY